MNGKVFSVIGILGIISTLIVAVTTFSSNDLLCAPFIVIGILMSIVIIALGKILYLLEKNWNDGGTKNEQKK